MGSKQDAQQTLDYALFSNVYNMSYNENDYQITFEGDNYVVWDLETNELHHFVVEIREELWDSSEVIAEQEWDVND